MSHTLPRQRPASPEMNESPTATATSLPAGTVSTGAVGFPVAGPASIASARAATTEVRAGALMRRIIRLRSVRLPDRWPQDALEAVPPRHVAAVAVVEPVVHQVPAHAPDDERFARTIVARPTRAGGFGDQVMGACACGRTAVSRACDAPRPRCRRGSAGPEGDAQVNSGERRRLVRCWCCSGGRHRGRRLDEARPMRQLPGNRTHGNGTHDGHGDGEHLLLAITQLPVASSAHCSCPRLMPPVVGAQGVL